MLELGILMQSLSFRSAVPEKTVVSELLHCRRTWTPCRRRCVVVLTLADVDSPECAYVCVCVYSIVPVPSGRSEFE